MVAPQTKPPFAFNRNSCNRLLLVAWCGGWKGAAGERGLGLANFLTGYTWPGHAPALDLFLAQRGILSATPLNMKRGKRKAGGASAAAGSGAQRALVDVRGVGQQIVVQFDPGKAANGKKGKKATRPKFWAVDSDVRKQHGLGSGSFTLGAGAAFDPPP